MHRGLLALAGRGRAVLRDRELVGARTRVVAALDLDLGRAGLAVPEPELLQIRAGGVRHGGDEVVAGRGLAVLAFHVEVHAALGPPLAAERGLIGGAPWR